MKSNKTNEKDKHMEIQKSIDTGFCYAPSEWQEYSDEHILAVRALDNTAPSIFETVRITRNHDGSVTHRHEVIFINDYLATAALPTVNRILTGFGYVDLDDFVRQNTASDEWVYDANGNLDRENSPSYIIDLWLLASLIAESRGGNIWPDEVEITMSEAEALQMLKKTTGLTYDTVGGFDDISNDRDAAPAKKHISKIKKDDVFYYDGDGPFVAVQDAFMDETVNGIEWVIAASEFSARLLDNEDGEVRLYLASLFEDGEVEMAKLFKTISKHISTVAAGDRIFYGDMEYTAKLDASLTKTGVGKEWNVECVNEYGEDSYLYASYFEEGFVHIIIED